MRHRLPDAHLGAFVRPHRSACRSARRGGQRPGVARARDIQRARFEGAVVRTNAEAEGELLDRVATPEPGGIKLLTEAAGRMRLSARGYSRVVRVGRTIADLAGAPTVLRPHIAEALSYRRLALQS